MNLIGCPFCGREPLQRSASTHSRPPVRASAWCFGTPYGDHEAEMHGRTDAECERKWNTRHVKPATPDDSPVKNKVTR